MPGAPVMSTRELVGATLSTVWRTVLMALELPISSDSECERRLSSWFSLRSLAASSARLTMMSSRSDWKGFSM